MTDPEVKILMLKGDKGDGLTDDDMRQVKSQIDANSKVLNSRIDNLILSSGNESSAEVTDARTGYDGAAYATLGTAIRSQASELKEDIKTLNLNTNSLSGLTVYGFGDSLMYGHYEKVGILDRLAEKYRWKYSKFAFNGATVRGNSASSIIYQITNAPRVNPDCIILDGMMNDTYPDTVIGEITNGYDDNWAQSTYCGGLEKIFYTIRSIYSDTPTLFICCHKTPSRDITVQDKIQEKTRLICNKWSIPYVDIYRKGQINCCIDSLRKQYSYNNEGETHYGNGTHLTGNAYKQFYAPMIEQAMRNMYF